MNKLPAVSCDEVQVFAFSHDRDLFVGFLRHFLSQSNTYVAADRRTNLL
jgi:hypothetical protein